MCSVQVRVCLWQLRSMSILEPTSGNADPLRISVSHLAPGFRCPRHVCCRFCRGLRVACSRRLINQGLRAQALIRRFGVDRAQGAQQHALHLGNNARVCACERAGRSGAGHRLLAGFFLASMGAEGRAGGSAGQATPLHTGLPIRPPACPVSPRCAPRALPSLIESLPSLMHTHYLSVERAHRRGRAARRGAAYGRRRRRQST